MSSEIDIKLYKTIFENIKYEVLNSQYKAVYSANKELIIMYWNIGRIILDNSEWGNKFIDNISADLKLEFPQTTRFFSQKFEIYEKICTRI